MSDSDFLSTQKNVKFVNDDPIDGFNEILRRSFLHIFAMLKYM